MYSARGARGSVFVLDELPHKTLGCEIRDLVERYIGALRKRINAKRSPGRLVVEDESKCPVSGKRKYATEGEALSTAAHQVATTHAPKDLHAYFCSWCDAWHLTKNTGKAPKGRR